jgi:aspartyl-tRNA(Asn)/glutamyl-tRNA(Gln) amidotransferase subunit A
MSDAPLWSLTATELVDGYRAAQFSPAQALAAVLQRLEAVNPSLNAIIAVDREGAAEAALASAERWRTGNPLSALDGVPISVKDNLFLHGLPATWGSRLLANFSPDVDEAPIARLRGSGAILFGKTNVPEFTVQGYTNNLVFGVTTNPHAPGRTPGGSTGGGAAAVAAGIGPIAIGTDAGGSIRRPAAHCGLFALKPSIGLVPRYGGFPQFLADFEVIGVIARSAADLETARAILEVYDPVDPRSLAASAPTPSFAAAPRIAFLPSIGANPVDARIAAEAQRLAQKLAASGATVTTIEAPFDADRVTATWQTIVTSGIAWYLSRFPDWRERVGPSARALAEEGTSRSAGELQDALAAAAEIRSAAGRFFADFDLLLCPATAALAWPAEATHPPLIEGRAVGPRGHAVFTGWMNIAGLPAVTAPVAMTQHEGGIGLQLVARHGRDRALVEFLTSAPALKALSPATCAKLS